MLVYDSLFCKPVQQPLQRVPLDPCGISFDTYRQAMKDSVGSGSIPGYMLLDSLEGRLGVEGAEWVKGDMQLDQRTFLGTLEGHQVAAQAGHRLLCEDGIRLGDGSSQPDASLRRDAC